MPNDHRRTTTGIAHSCAAASILLAAAGFAISATSAFAQETAAPQQQYTIAAGDLADALDSFAGQTRLQIIYNPDIVTGRTVPAISGSLSANDALTLLLEGAGLEWEFVNEKTVVVRAPKKAQGADARDDAASAVVAQAAEEGGQTVDSADIDPGVAAPGEATTSSVETARRGGIEEIIVTAQKKEERIQDIPIAISAFSAESLQEQKIEGGFDLLKAIPNVTFSKNNFTGYNFSIRGVGTKAVSPTTDPGVAVEFNDTPLIRNRLFEQEYFDVERVEVLRGPQGTLHGRNATSGVINVISAKPKLGEFLGSVKLEGGNYSAQRAVGMVNVPIVQDVLGVRLAGSMTKRDGYGTNLYDGSDVDGRDLWSGRMTVGFEPTPRLRADLIWEHFEEDDNRQRTSKQLCTRDPGPTHVGTAAITPELGNGAVSLEAARAVFSQGCLPKSLYGDSAFGTPNGLAIPFISALATNNAGLVGYFPVTGDQATALMTGVDPYGNTTQSRDLRAIYSQIPSVYRASADLLQFNVGFDISDALTLTSQTAYNEDEIYASQDYNRYTTFPAFTDTSNLNAVGTLPGASAYQNLIPGGFFCDPQLGCANTVVGMDISSADSKQFSQELRLQSSFDGPLNFSIGINYLKYETVEDYYVFFNAITLATVVSLNGGGLGGAKEPDRVTTNPDCSYASQQFSLLGNVYCVPIEQNSIDNIQDIGHNYFLSRNPYELESKSVFGEVYWEAMEALRLTLGLRYTDDRKKFTIIPSQTALTPRDYIGIDQSIYRDYLLGTAFAGTGFGYPIEGVVDLGWQEMSGRLAFDWKPVLEFTDQTMVYGSYSRGYKGGGMNPPPIGLNYAEAEAAGIIYAPSAPRNFDPEFVNAFEIGTKNTLMGGSVVLNVGAFYYNYKNYQVSKIVDRSAQNENFDAEVWGLELESVVSPTPNLRLNASLGYLDTRIGDGERSIDLMNRTAGNDDWVVTKPALTHSSNCIVPASLVELLINSGANWIYTTNWACPGGSLLGSNYAGRPDVFGLVTALPDGSFYDPADYPEANFGTGFFTDVSGNELPNAPHWTATLGAQYTKSLKAGWDLTLRGDAYWQSESYARVYNLEYDRLHAWKNFNVSLWLEKLDWGLKAEVYVKNLLDESPITDAFLNSDDSALTTNVFTLDPRLVGISIRKDF